MKEDLKQRMQTYIEQHQRVDLTKLSDVFHISMSTVRRYIDRLTDEGICSKYYGGVRSNHTVTPVIQEPPADPLEPEKRRIAQAAASFIQNHDIIYIDSGSTTQYIPEYIPQETTLTIVTNNYLAIRSALALPNCTIISLPGKLNRTTFSFISEQSASYLDSFNIHKAFLACTGITIADGATNTFSEEHATKALAARKAKETFLLADHRKFGISTLITYCPLHQINTIITEVPVPGEFVTACKSAGTAIIIG
jgi:DeoR family myo-inositol catabolism operon transcriptional repressor